MTFVPTPGLVLPGTTIGRHAITSGGIDPNTCNQISQLCPTGGQYSMRLGNWNIDWETEDIMFTYTVDPANPILLYSYVPILEDPNHPDTLQPAFKTYIKDSTGAMVPCSYYRVTATNMRAYSTCITWRGTQIRYTNWREVAIDMSAYAGQRMTLYFHTNDCGWGAHFGYAYIDVIRCYPKSIQLPPCGTPLPWIITAPPGFASYQWSTGQSGQTITINQPVLNLSCQVTSFQGCQITLSASTNNITPTLSAISHN